MKGVGEKSSGGRPQAPAVCLLRTEEVTPTGEGIHAVGHTRHWGSLRPGGIGATGSLHTGPVPGPRRRNPRERGRTPTG